MRYFWFNSINRRFSGRLLRAISTLFLAVVLSAALLRMSPGWNVAEADLDPRLSMSTVEALREERAARRNLPEFYADFLRQTIRGNFGKSEVFERPVIELIAERAGTTIHSVSAGLLTGWILALLVAIATANDRTGFTTAGAVSVSGTLLSFPSALLAVLCLLLDLPPAAVIAAVVFPRVFPHADEQLRTQLKAPHVLMARARGVSGLTLFRSYVVPGTVPALSALAGATVPLAFGAAIPVESLADSPGLGQLAWQAALGRDMPLLVSLTLLLASVSVAANLVADRSR
jgi:peptide/nickel transport system permease protein